MILEPLFQTALTHHRAGRLNDAITSYKKVLRRQPKNHDALHLLGLTYLAQGRAAEGIKLIKRAIAYRPDFAEAHYNLGIAQKKRGENNAAIQSYRRAIELEPGNAGAHTNLGNLLKRMMRYDEAVSCYEKAIAVNPDNAVALNNLGITFRAMNRLGEAIQAFDRSLAVDPHLDDVRFKRAEILLSQAAFADGWRNYLDRSSLDGRDKYHRTTLAQDLAGRSIRVDHDQGLGDEIFFLRFVDELRTRGAYVSYLPDPRLADMLGRADIADRILDWAAPDRAQGFDLRLSVGDLPYLLGMKNDTPLPRSITISPLADARQRLHAQLEALGPQPYVGITWRAGTRDNEDLLFKEVPQPRLAESIKDIDATFLALQRLPETGEVAAFEKELGSPLHDLTGLNSNLEAMLALMSLIDAYVCVSNTNVHLRTATGLGSHVLVPNPPEFRWMAEGKVSPWFPDSVVYRQYVDGDWQPALAELGQDLWRQFGAGCRAGRPSD